MDDLLKLLDSNVGDVTAGLKGLSHDDLLKLQAAERDGKTRTGVLDALDLAIAQAEEARAGGKVQMAPAGSREDTGAESDALTSSGSAGIGIAADLDTSGPANIDPAAEIDTAGAPQQIVPDVDLSHPAVDSHPRAGTTDHMNRIDFNDPVKSGREVVEEQLRAGA